MPPSNVVMLHARPAPLAPFLRVGHTGQNKLEALIAGGRMPYRRFVFDAAHVRKQMNLVQTLKVQGAEVVLDLNFAETAEAGRYQSAASKLPWGNPERPWSPSDFGMGRNADFFKLMAEFAVEVGATAVLAPVHVDEGKTDAWRSFDLDACPRLRVALDHAGGGDIAIDYQLITTMASLKDPASRGRLIDGHDELPYQNLWLRVSGFGASATGVGTRQLIESVRQLHPMGRPLVLDMAGGFAGVSALAFGVAGGLSHGVGMNESFAVSDWRKPPKDDRRGGGSAVRVYIPDLDRHLKAPQAEAFFAARGTKASFGCRDTSCCPTGLDDMTDNSHAHFITQRHRQIAAIDRLPEDRRAEHFLLQVLDPAVRSVRKAAKLKFADEGVGKVVAEAKSRLMRFRDALGDLNSVDSETGAVTRARPPAFRGRPANPDAGAAARGGRP